MDMTRESLIRICKEHKLYRTPGLNEKLYCNFKGFRNLTPALAAYYDLRALFLEGNALESLNGMPCLENLRCLFVQQNLLGDLSGIERLPNLDTLNISNNRIGDLNALSNCAKLTTLIATGNQLETKNDLLPLLSCTSLVSLDLQNNKLADEEILDVLESLPNLRCVYLKGNDVVSKIRNYRKRLIAKLQNLTYLDERPVFEAERRMAEAWARGGLEAERIEREKIKEEEKERDRVNFEHLQKIRREGWRKKREKLGLPPGDTDPYLDHDSEEDVEAMDEPEELKTARKMLSNATVSLTSENDDMEDAQVYLESVKQNHDELVADYEKLKRQEAELVDFSRNFDPRIFSMRGCCLRNFIGSRIDECDAEQDESIHVESDSQGSLYRFFFDQYSDRIVQLESELTDLVAIDAIEYAKRSVLEIQNGTRTQQLLSRIKQLRKELRICQYRTTSSYSPSDDLERYPRIPIEDPPCPDEHPEVECPLPEWLVRNMKENPVKTIDQKRRLELLSESSVLTLAGRVVSTCPIEQKSRYHEENKDNNKLMCSHFKPQIMTEDPGPFPCVIYCHGNSGSRRDAEEAVSLLIPQQISVFCFDFSGSGLSDGQWVTLGAREVHDLEVVVEHLRGDAQTSTIALWGRSMGAVTSLLYSRLDPSIAGMVLDSPFSRLTDLALELVHEQQVPIPRTLVKVALALIRRSVRKKAQFDINTIAPVDTVDQSFVPVLFGHADEDDFIRKVHSERLMERYAGDKNLITFPGDHNSRRTQFFYSSVTIFLHNVMKIQRESVEVQPDLPVVNRPNRGPQLIDHEAYNINDDGGDGDDDDDDVNEADLAALMMLTQNQNEAENRGWESVLPVSRAEEDRMLQAALTASFMDVSKEDNTVISKQQEQSTSTEIPPEENKADPVDSTQEDPPNPASN
eukprot:g4488.t1